MLNSAGELWFSPKVDYEHWSGGTNGTDFLWDSVTLSFNGDKPKWKYGRKLL